MKPSRMVVAARHNDSMRWAWTTVIVTAGAGGAVLLFMRFAADDSTFFANPVVVGGLLVGVIATVAVAVFGPAGAGALWILPTSIGGLLFAAGVAVQTHAALAVALTSALRMPIMAGLGLTSLWAARRDGWRVPRWTGSTIAVVATGGFLALLFVAPQETPFGDFRALIDVPTPMLPFVAAIGIGLVQLTTAGLVVVPVGIWWATMRVAHEARRRRLTLAAITSTPIGLYAVALLLATWRGDSQSPAAAAWLTLALSGAVLAVGVKIAGLASGAGVPERGLDTLTQRENEVLSLLADGHTNQAIADQLVVSKRTVDAHVRSLFMKLGVAGVGNPRVRAADAWRRQPRN